LLMMLLYIIVVYAVIRHFSEVWKRYFISCLNAQTVRYFEKNMIEVEEDRIPRTIHRIWLGGPFPEKYGPALAATQDANPSFDQRRWGDEEIDKLMNTVYGDHPIWGSRVRDAYNSINPSYGAARADLARYALLYAHGGVYMDAKCSATDLLPVLKGSRFVCSFWSDAATGFPHIVGELQNGWFASEAGHPTLNLVISKVIQNIENYKERSNLEIFMCKNMNFLYDTKIVLKVTGPVPFTNMVKKSKPDWGVRVLRRSGVITEDHLGTHKYGNGYRKNCQRLILPMEEGKKEDGLLLHFGNLIA